MNNASKVRLSLRKLLLAALAVGPLAVLPAPLWAALPTAGVSYTTTNGSVTLSTSGVNGAGTALIQTSDRAVLVWNAGHFNIAVGETFNFAVPTGGGVLNKVGYTTSGSLAGATDNAIIDGSLISTGGRVFVLANGNIMVGGGATINTAGGLVLSTLQESSDFAFTTTGNLSLSGNSLGSITIGTAGASPSLSGGLDVSAGSIVLNRAAVTGDLVLRQVTATTGLNLATSGPLSVSGNLTATTNNGAISATNAVTVGVGSAGTQTTTLSTGVGGAASITLGSVTNDFEVVSATALGATADVTLGDANSLTLGASSVGRDLIVTAVGTANAPGIDNSGTLTIARNAGFTVTTAGNSSVTVGNNSTIGGVIAASVNNAKVSVSTSGPLTVGVVGATNGITSTVGANSAIGISTTGALNINAPLTSSGGTDTNAQGIVLAGTTITQDGNGDITHSGGNRTVTITSSGGSVTLGDINARAVSVRANSGSISQTAGTTITTSTSTSTFNATNGGSITLNNANSIFADSVLQLIGGTIAVTNSNATRLGTTNATGSVTLSLGNNALVLGTGDGTAGQDIVIGGVLNVTSGAISSTSYTNINIAGGLNLNTSATNAAVTLNGATFTIPADVRLGRVDINAGTGAVTVAETQTLNLGTITAGSLTARSTAGGVIDSGTINIGAGGTLTLVAPTNQEIVLDVAGHSVPNVTVSGGMNNSLLFGGAGTTLGGSNTASLTLASGAGVPLTIGAAGTVNNLTVNSGGTITVNGATTISGNLSLTAADTGVAAITDTAAGQLIVTGNTTLSSPGDIVLDGAGANSIHDFSNVIVTTARDVTVNDTNNLTIWGNATGAFNARAGDATATGTTIANTWALTLGNIHAGSMTVRAASGGGNSGAITQQANTKIHSTGAAMFQTANGAITVNRTGNNFGRVSFTSGSGATNITEDGTLRLGALSTTAATRLESRFGSIIEDNELNNTTTLGTAQGVLTLVAAQSVLLGNTTRPSTSTGTTTGNLTSLTVTAPAGAVAVRSTGNTDLTLGTITALSLNVTKVAAGGLGGNITQAGNSSLKIFGTTSVTADGNIALSSEANNFGRLSLSSTVANSNISVVENATINLGSVSMGNTGTSTTGNGTFTARSVNGDIIDTGLAGVKLGGIFVNGAPISGSGVVTLTASNGSITLDDPTTDFTTTAGVVFNAKNSVVLSPLGQTPLILGAANTTSTAASLVARTAVGNISSLGNLNIAGSASFESGTGNIVVSQAGNRFGSIKFAGNQVSISQTNDMNIERGSSARSAAQLASTGSYVTIVPTGSGVVSFGDTVSISAGSSINLPKLLQAVGTLTVNAPELKDLSALSVSSDLGGKQPNNQGAGPYNGPGL